jgi:hypothetical protein
MKEFNLKVAKHYLLSEIKINKPGGSRVYVGEPTGELGVLFKIEDFPSIHNIDGIPYDYEDENPKLWEIIEKIQKYLQHFDINDIRFTGDFLNGKEAYIYIDNELNYNIVDFLDQFEEGYQTKEDFGVQNWKKI